MTSFLIGLVLAVTVGVMARGLARGNPARVVDGLWVLCIGVGIVFAEWGWMHGKLGIALGAFGGMSAMAGLLFGVRMVIYQEHKRSLGEGSEGEAPTSKSASARPQGWFGPLLGLLKSRGDGGAHVTRLGTRYLRMAFDQEAGTLSGTVRRGHLRGKSLSSLSFYQLMDLRDICARADNRSAAVLETWLDRHMDGWRVRAGLELPESERPQYTNGAAEMSAEEARLVLGVDGTATPDTIKDAHRRLMQRLHPDLGGSTYLAAKVNEARDILIGG